MPSQHHWHGVQSSYDDGGDAECCICPDNPCGAVTVADMLAHREYDRALAERWGEIHARQQISDAISKTLDELPENSLCEVGEEVYRLCWVLARGNIDEPPF